LSARIDGGSEKDLHQDSPSFQWKISLVIRKQSIMTFAAGRKLSFIDSRHFNR
jgi:hypothetical protein